MDNAQTVSQIKTQSTTQCRTFLIKHKVYKIQTRKLSLKQTVNRKCVFVTDSIKMFSTNLVNTIFLNSALKKWGEKIIVIDKMSTF